MLAHGKPLHPPIRVRRVEWFSVRGLGPPVAVMAAPVAAAIMVMPVAAIAVPVAVVPVAVTVAMPVVVALAEFPVESPDRIPELAGAPVVGGGGERRRRVGAGGQAESAGRNGRGCCDSHENFHRSGPPNVMVSISVVPIPAGC